MRMSDGFRVKLELARNLPSHKPDKLPVELRHEHLQRGAALAHGNRNQPDKDAQETQSILPGKQAPDD